jgi:taurine dioxygenase
MSLKVTPLTGSIGGLVEGIDLKRPIDRATFAELHRAILTYQMLVFRGQNLFEAKDLLEFSKLWGNPVPASALSPHLEGYPEVTHVTKIPKETAHRGLALRLALHTGPAQDLDPRLLTVPHGGDDGAPVPVV